MFPVRKTRAKSSARHTKKRLLKLPLPWLVISVFAVFLVFITADFLPKAEKSPAVTPARTQQPSLTELSLPDPSALSFTLQKVEVLPQEGDTLWSLAEEFYGNGAKWTVLAAENNLKNGRLTMGKTLTVSQEISPKVISPERVYRVNFAGPLPPTLTLPGGQLQVPTEKAEVLSSPDGTVDFDQSSVIVKNGPRTETYVVGAGLMVTDHFLANLNGQQYAVYLYADPIAPTATDFALFNLTSLKQ